MKPGSLARVFICLLQIIHDQGHDFGLIMGEVLQVISRAYRLSSVFLLGAAGNYRQQAGLK